MAESWEGKDGYAPKSHGHDQYVTHDDINTLKQELLGNIMDWLPVGTVLWFKQNVTLSNKWTVCTELIGRYPLGATSELGSTVEAGLPNITGYIPGDTNGTTDGANFWNCVGGAFYMDTVTTNAPGNTLIDYDNQCIGFNASLSSEVYGKSDTVTPPSIKLIPYIKIA